MNKPTLLIGLLVGILHISTVCAAEQYARVSMDGEVRHARVNGDQLELLEAGLFPLSALSGETVARSSVELLPPTHPEKVFAVGMNFASHLASKASAPPPLFLKLPSSLIAHNQTIKLPEDSNNVHFEGELVLVVGKRAKNVSEENAPKYIFGVTVGNDLTERSWQRRDLQWLRAKASDGFGPVGPTIATGIDYNNVVLTTRLNDEIVQQENTKNIIHSPAKVLSYLSQYFTLEPGDLIFMGTPGKTRALNNGDTVSVSIDGIGTLLNRIAQ